VVRSVAAAALGQIGPGAKEALPALRMALEDKDAGVRVEAADSLWKVGKETSAGIKTLSTVLKEGQPAPAGRAAQVLGEMGSVARAGVPALQAALANKDSRVRILAAEALWKVAREGEAPAEPIREPVLGVLAAEVKNDDADLRQLAVRAAGEVGAVDLLVGALKDPEERVRREAACGLVNGGEKRKLEPAVLRRALEDSDSGVRWWSALAWLVSPLSTKGAEEDLLEALRTPWQPVPGEREAPGGTIIQDVLASSTGRALPALERILTNRPLVFRVEAARAYGLFGTDAQPAIPTLLATLGTDDKFVRRAAAESLGAVGPEVIPALIKALGSPNARVQEGAARALAGQGELARSARPALLDLLKRKSDEVASTVRAAAAVALWQMDRSPDPALAVLQLVLLDVDNPDRWEAMEGIAQIAAEAWPPIRGLTEVLLQGAKDRDARVRVHAVRGLWRREGQPRTVTPLLNDAVSDRDPLVRQTALETLGEMPLDAAVIGLLVKAFDDRDPSVRAAGLAGLFRGGQSSVQPLVETLSHKNPRVRAGVARALGRIGPTAKDAVPALTELSKDRDESVRNSAEMALRQIRRK
jgi:HEAT repeat protein